MPRLGSGVRASFPAPFFLTLRNEYQSASIERCLGKCINTGADAMIRRDSKAVMHWIANPRRPVRLRLAPPLTPDVFSQKPVRPGGGIGRHRRFKISRPYGRAGSIPAPGTIS